MATRSPTVLRNKEIVGNNSKSYNDKHPENPISLRPIRDARKKTRNRKLRAIFLALRNSSRPVIARELFRAE